LNKVAIIQSIDKRIPLEDIAKSRSMKYNDLVTELETIVLSGTKVNINYHLDSILDDDSIDVIYDYFRESESDSLDEAFKELKDEGLSYDDIRLVRLKFLSEMAN
jgi:ATP-dependent DNA helicase RecQ